MKKKAPYVVSKKDDFYYCHMRGYDYVPVFGSVGDRSKANKVCRMMNESAGFYEQRRKDDR